MNNTSTLTPPASATYAVVTMHKRDRLRFIQFPEDIHIGINAVLRKAWASGIQSQSYICGAYEYKFVGRPFGSTGDKAGVASRLLMRDVLAFLYERSWILNTSLAQSRHLGSKDTLIFRAEQPSAVETAVAPPPVDWLVLGISKNDRLRLIGDTSPGTLVQSLRRELERLGAFESGEWNAKMGVDGGFEFKLKGSPWKAWRGEDPVKSRLLILRIIEVLDGHGWRSYGTIRQRTGDDSYQKADTWYFVKAQDYVPGSPFNSEPLRTLPGLEPRLP